MAWDTANTAPPGDTAPVSMRVLAARWAPPPADPFAADVAAQAARAVWSYGARTLTDDIAALVGARIIEGSLSFDAVQRLMLAALVGKTIGAGTLTEEFRSVADDKTRVETVFDVAGNRTTITLDGTP